MTIGGVDGKPSPAMTMDGVDGKPAPAMTMGGLLAFTLASLLLAAAIAAMIFIAQQVPPPSEPLGMVRFPISCGGAAQAAFNHATAELYALDYPGAAHDYTALAAADPDCAMADWGLAMAALKRPVATPPSAADLRRVRAALAAAAAAHGATPRERAYLAAVTLLADGPGDWQARTIAYADAMQALTARYPGDREAPILTALALNMATPPESQDFSRRTKATELLLVALSEQPDHPGITHYLSFCLGAGADASRDAPAAPRYPMAQTTRRLLLTGLGTLVAFGFGTLIVLGPPIWRQEAMAEPPAPIGGPFSLVAADGKPVTDQTFRGKWMLVYFGYTNCPDICPTTLADIAATLAQLGPEAVQVQPLFISIDPERDTPPVIGAYVKNFDERILGLTGTPEQVAAAAKAYRVYYRKEPTPDAPNGYLMQHSAFVYVVDPQGQYVTLFSPMQGQGPAQMAARLKTLLSRGS